MVAKIACLANFLAIYFGCLYAGPIPVLDRSYDDVPNEVVGKDIGFSNGEPVPTCPQKCKSRNCDAFTVNAECYENYNSDIIPRKLNKRVRRNAMNILDWPKTEDGLIYIPYSFNTQIIEARLEDVLRKAEQEFEKHTCYRLKQRTDEDNYVSIVEFKGCWSNAGMVGGKQYMSLASYCGTLDTVLHEFMHVIGFLHEMNRRDRNENIRINWRNVNTLFLQQFMITGYGIGFTHGKEYDINSLLHYGNKMAAVDKNIDTMTSVKSPDAMLGVERGASFSEGDKRMIKYKGFCNVDVKMHSGPYADTNNML